MDRFKASEKNHGRANSTVQHRMVDSKCHSDLEDDRRINSSTAEDKYISCFFRNPTNNFQVSSGVTGKSHIAANGFILFSLSADPVLAASTVICARLPDQAEKFLPGVRHRTLTHHLYFWVSMTLFSGFFPWARVFPQTETWVFQGITGIFLGGALHVLMDMFSKSGVPIFPGKVWGARFYTTGSYSEYLFLAGLMLVCGVAFLIKNPSYVDIIRSGLGF